MPIINSSIKKSLTTGLMLLGLIFVFSQSKETTAQLNIPPDAIAVRVVKNTDHISPVRWYYENVKQPGSPSQLLVDGYKAVRDGRTVYVSAANINISIKQCSISGERCDSNPIGYDCGIDQGYCTYPLYTNIYIISYTQDSVDNTVDIFGQLLRNWHFNTNVVDQAGAGGCYLNGEDLGKGCFTDYECGDAGKAFCTSAKAKITRDVRRLADLQDIKLALDNYSVAHGGGLRYCLDGGAIYSPLTICSDDTQCTAISADSCDSNPSGVYPALTAGTYEQNVSLSVWPSWQETLGAELDITMPLDPVNKFSCQSPFDPDTCWNEATLRFDGNIPGDLAGKGHAYMYRAITTAAEAYQLCAVMEVATAAAPEFACPGSGTLEGISQVLGVNRLPIISVRNRINVPFGQTLDELIYAYDPDGQIVSWVIDLNGVSGINEQPPTSPNYRRVTGTPSANGDITITVTDNRGAITEVVASIILGSYLCGNSQLNIGEECDDGKRCENNNNICSTNSDCQGSPCVPLGGDGCSAECRIETQYACVGVPSICRLFSLACQPNPDPCGLRVCGTVINTCGESISCGVCPLSETCNVSGQCEVIPATETSCNDGTDNDLNGQTDCADSACWGQTGTGGLTCCGSSANCAGIGLCSVSANTCTPDIIYPVIASLNLAQGSVIVSWNATDAGGSHLATVEIWRANDNGGVPGAWARIDTVPVSGDSSVSSYADTNVTVGNTYWYGIHVTDVAGNCTTEWHTKCNTSNPTGQLNPPGSKKITVTALGTPPVAVIGASPGFSGNDPFEPDFNSAGSNDPDGGILTYAWDFDNNGTIDSTFPDPAQGAFTYSPAGNYMVKLTVTDDEGSTNSATQTITATAAGAPGDVRFSSATFSGAENSGQITITVERIGGSTGAILVDYTTNNGTAIGGGTDFTTTLGTLDFSNGITTRFFIVPIVNDTLPETPDETFSVILSNPVGTTIVAPITATVTIIDNDVADSTPPVISNVQPPNNSIFTGGTTSKIISLDTSENAQCRYHTDSAAFAVNFNSGTLFGVTNNTTHNFTFGGMTNGGSYTLYYRCMDAAGNISSATQHNFSVNTPPVASFTYVVSGLNVQFTDTSTDAQGNGTINSWNWTFDDSTTSTEQNPLHNYASGAYVVDLTISDGIDSHTVTKGVTVSSAACSDGLDNDSDGYTDFNIGGSAAGGDPGCSSPSDTDEKTLVYFNHPLLSAYFIVLEGAVTPQEISVICTGGTTESFQIHYQIQQTSCSPVDLLCDPDTMAEVSILSSRDVLPQSGDLTFTTCNDEIKTYTLSLNNDTLVEPTEAFRTMINWTGAPQLVPLWVNVNNSSFNQEQIGVRIVDNDL
ncbi:MAG: PKD domain-containing protein [bacterium]|nr:PKD domain-containing protein [bacterium]